MAIVLAYMVSDPVVVYDFNRDSKDSDWIVVDDVVMGGRSEGGFTLSEKGHGVFSGKVSLENNGGFSSVRHRFASRNVEEFSKFVIRLKGDGKAYQFRVKSEEYDRHSYISYFQTTGEWQTIEINFSEMYPSFRGRKLDMPNFPGKTMEEITFLISNNKEESYRMEVDLIGIE